MNNTRLCGFTMFLWLLLVIACGANGASAPSEANTTFSTITTYTSDDGENSFEMHATTPVLSLDELGDMSAIVVLGKVARASATQKTRNFFGADYRFHLVMLDVEVKEYFRGSGPETIKVASYDTAKHPSAPRVERGRTYVFYLTQWETQEDRNFYDNTYYLGLAHQGIWEVDGNNAIQQLFEKNAKLDDLRKTAAAGFEHDILDYENYLQKAHLLSHDLSMSTSELSAISELIVRGTPVGEATAKDSPNYPASYSQVVKAQDETLLQEVKVFSFRVEQYYKGAGPSIVNIFTDGSGEYPFINESTSYVLYLHKADFEAARAYYDDPYVIVAAGQGTWVVNDDKALQQFGNNKSVNLSDLESR